MEKKDSFLLITYIISFVISWILLIFYVEKDEFDLEYREKGNTTATIFNIDISELEEESYGGKKIYVNEINYVEYSYYVDGLEYKGISNSCGENFSISNKIEIEYINSNPSVSKIKGQCENRFNFFTRKLILVIFFTLIVTLLISKVFELTFNSEKLNK